MFLTALYKDKDIFQNDHSSTTMLMDNELEATRDAATLGSINNLFLRNILIHKIASAIIVIQYIKSLGTLYNKLLIINKVLSTSKHYKSKKSMRYAVNKT